MKYQESGRTIILELSPLVLVCQDTYLCKAWLCIKKTYKFCISCHTYKKKDWTEMTNGKNMF